MGRTKKVYSAMFLLSFSLLIFSPVSLFGQEDVRALREEMRQMREDSEKQRQRMQALEEKLQRMDAQSEQKAKELEQKVASQTSSWVDRFLNTQAGDRRFLITADGFGNYIWRSKRGDQNERRNSFQAGFSPIFLFRMNDWIMFESEVELEVHNTDTEVGVEYAQVLAFLNDYMTLGVGKFLLPFGEFLERLEPKSVNKFVTSPLPYREADDGGLFNIGEVGAQLRGAIPLGTSPGPQAEYALYVGNGPRFDRHGRDDHERGENLENNHTDNNGAKAWGARVGFRPFPFDWEAGRLKLGASTYNGIWGRGRWLNTWGLDTVYQYEPFEFRAEYIGFHREMGFGEKKDNRNGWYLQGGYKLNAVPVRFIDRSEVVVRFGGVNQPKNPDEDFAKRPRQFSLGWDYHLNPSSMWKLEFDRDFPRGDKTGNQFLTQWVVRF